MNLLSASSVCAFHSTKWEQTLREHYYSEEFISISNERNQSYIRCVYMQSGKGCPESVVATPP